MRELERLLAAAREEEEEEGVRVGEVYACRINAGLFGVEWGRTRAVLVGEGVLWRVVEFKGGQGGGRGEGREVGEGEKGGEVEAEEGEEGSAGLEQDGAMGVARGGKRRRVG